MRAGDGARADESLRKFAILLLCFSSLAFSTSREGNIISFSFVSNHQANVRVQVGRARHALTPGGPPPRHQFSLQAGRGRVR